MPILVDYSQVVISNIMGYGAKQEITEDFARHIILNTLRSYKMRFGKKYGDLIICCDSGDVWRKDIYPEYKASRKKQRDADDKDAKAKGKTNDWPMIFECMHMVRRDLKEFFPYQVLMVPKCEADDIIAVLCKSHRKDINFLLKNDKPILILSSDKDLVQLHKYGNIDQYSIRKKKMIGKGVDHSTFLREHVLRGDTGDGVPNYLSDDDAFVNENKRQNQLSQKKIDQLVHLSHEDFLLTCNTATAKNFNRNDIMINLDKIPDEYVAAIKEAEQNTVPVKRNKMYSYMVKNRMNLLLKSISEF